MSNAPPPVPPVPRNDPVIPKMDEPAMPAPEGAEEPQEELPHGGFWANPMVASVTGAATSILVHAAIIIVGLLLIPDVRQLVTDMVVVEEQTIIPTAELATEQPGGIPNPGMNSDATRAAAQMVDASVTQSDAFNDQKSQSLDAALASGDPTESSMPIGTGIKTGGGLAGGGKLAAFGAPGGGAGIGPKGAVFGNGGNAYKIVFVCDGTGTMLGLKQALLVRELNSTIAKLKPVQEFNVIFFNEDQGSFVTAVDMNKLMPAIPPNVRKTSDWLSKFSFRGSTNPIPAIELAFKQKPQLMYILSDGEFDNLTSYDEVIKTINDLNADKKIKINTIMFGDRDPRAEQALKKIADDNGGRMVYVSLEALQKG
jgi:hypothetical protein